MSSEHLRRMARPLVVLGATVIIGIAASGSAGAGGAHFRLDRDGYRPGDPVVARSAVAWAHNERLGTPDDGPYLVYLIAGTRLAQLSQAGLPDAAAIGEAIPVGAIEVVPGPIEEDPEHLPGVLFGPYGAIARFTLPDVAPGTYALLHCNDPCTTHLGDLLGGTLVVLEPDGSRPAGAPPPPDHAAEAAAFPAPRPATTVAPVPSPPPPPPTTATAPTTVRPVVLPAADPAASDHGEAELAAGTGRLVDHDGTSSRGPLVVLGIGAAAAAAVVVGRGSRSGRRPEPPARGSRGADG